MLPQTPLDRLLAAGTLAAAAALMAVLAANREALRAERYVASTTQAAAPAVEPAARREPVAAPARRRTAPASPAGAAATPHRLSITAVRGPSWLEVRATSSGGAQLHYGLLAQGETKTFDRLPVWVRAGALHNLDVRVGQRPVSSLPAAPGGVTDFVASAAGVADTG